MVVARRALLSIFGGVLASILLAQAAAADQAPPRPMITLSKSGAQVGDTIMIQGTGWQAGSGDVATIVVCGNAALDGAVDCLLENTSIGVINSDGTFSTSLRVLAPPVACPCVVLASTPAVESNVLVPLIVTGAAVLPPQRQIHTRRAVVVDDVRLEGHGPWTSWFGGAAHRVLVFRVTNTGDVTLLSPTIDIAAGKGRSPSGYVAAPDLGKLDVHKSSVYRVPVTFPALSLGWYKATVRVDPLGVVGSASAGTVVVPWVLVAGLIGTLALIARGLRDRRNAKKAKRPGWYSDPLGVATLRLWDGAAWTGETFPPTPPDLSAVETVPDEAVVPGPEPGWYEDPLEPGQLRLWDGTAWTEETQALPLVDMV